MEKAGTDLGWTMLSAATDGIVDRLRQKQTQEDERDEGEWQKAYANAEARKEEQRDSFQHDGIILLFMRRSR